ncbi:hypothetical protein ACA910_007485 [Epithemia clementina (nom. ined.)]
MNVQVFDTVLEEDLLLSPPLASSNKTNNNQSNSSSDQSPQQPLPLPLRKLIGAIDQGTSSTRFLVFTPQGRILASAQTEHDQIYNPTAAGWHEHDPLQLWDRTQACIQAVGDALHAKNVNLQSFLAGVGITNQRETTIAWNRQTGIPYYNAIVWDDTRTQSIAEQVARGNPNRLRRQTGLPLAAYFAGTKVKWLLDNVEALRRDLQDSVQCHNVCFGTVDTWLMYQLTGEPALNTEKARNCQGLFCTDVTNASRWLFLDLETVQWDESLVNDVCAPHHLPLSCLPKICPSGHVFGNCQGSSVSYLANVPIASVLGDQQAALFGQAAFGPGEAKNTYGTGLFLMMNTGTERPQSQRLLTTIAYQLNETGAVHYALEGSVSHSGSTIQWLRDQLQIIPSAPDSEALATVHNHGLYFVPAFCGLFAPHWRSDARACLVGLTTHHHKGHVCRAALEAAAYQAKEVFDAIAADSGAPPLQALKVDGGGTANNLLMQFQADMLQVPVVKPVIQETTCLGVAYCAGLTVGVWKDLDQLRTLANRAVGMTYHPKMSDLERQANWLGWKKAVSRSIGWMDVVPEDNHNKSSSSSTTRDQPQQVTATAAAAATTTVALVPPTTSKEPSALLLLPDTAVVATTTEQEDDNAYHKHHYHHHNYRTLATAVAGSSLLGLGVGALLSTLFAAATTAMDSSSRAAGAATTLTSRSSTSGRS